MWRAAVVAATLTIGVTCPALAEPVPVDQAMTELRAAVKTSNISQHYVYWNSAGEVQVEYDAAGLYRRLAPGDEQLIVKDVGNFHRVSFTSDAVRAKVVAYLGAPQLVYELAAGPNAYQLQPWTDYAAGYLPGPVTLYAMTYLKADRTSVPPDTVYRLSNDKPSLDYAYEYRVDSTGRVVRRTTFEGDSQEVWLYETWDYATPVSLAVPPADQYRPIDDVHRAIQAATLNPKIKGMATRFAKRGRKHNFSVKKMRSWTASMVSFENQVGDGDENYLIARPLPLHFGKVPGGSKIYCRNPYTSTMHAWKIVKRSGAWRAVRMA